jgi:hypothetical protein
LAVVTELAVPRSEQQNRSRHRQNHQPKKLSLTDLKIAARMRREAAS